MELAVLGATGGTGRSLVEQAREAGHTVRVVARRPEAVPPSPGLTVTKGDATDPVAVAKGIAGADAVVNVVGVSGLLKARKGTTVYSGSSRAVISAMAEVGVRRLILVTSGGVIPQPGDGWFYTRVLKPFFLEPIYRDMRQAEALVRDSSTDWTLVRPSFLVGDKPRTDYRLAVDAPVDDDKTLSRWSLAHLLLAEAQNDAHVRRTVAASY